MSDELDSAVRALRQGEIVVYPTETVYGLGANALSERAINRVFAAKQRSHDNPISMAVSDIEHVGAYTRPTDRERAFMRAFLPGPVTVVLEREPTVPDVLTGGRDRVGVRIPDHKLARTLTDRFGPVTATSANVSGTPATTDVSELDPQIASVTAVVLDGGPTPGGGSTVVDVEREIIHREGPFTAEILQWLSDH